MRKWFILTSICALALIPFGCKKVKELLRFNISITSTQTIPREAVLGSLLVSQANVKSSQSQEFSNQGTRADLVKEARMESCKLVVKSPSGTSFNFLDLIEVFVEKSDGSDSKKIAFKNPVPSETGETLELDIDKSIVLDEYIRGDNFVVKTNYKVNKPIAQDIEFDIQMKFSVVADPL